MTPSAASALLRLQHATTETDARDLLALALHRGAMLARAHAAGNEDYECNGQSELARYVANSGCSWFDYTAGFCGTECTHRNLLLRYSADGRKELIHGNLVRVLQKLGVAEVDALHQPFDPTRHMAIGQIETTEAPSGHVAQVITKGYLLNGTVIRPAHVIVAK